jgi:hypothetical protein
MIGGTGATLVAFVVTALMIVALMVELSIAIAAAQERLVASLRASIGQVKRWGGAILVLVGLWLIVLATWAKTFAQVFPV